MIKPIINSQTQKAGDNATLYQANGDITVNNLCRSTDYQALQTELEKARKRVTTYPNDLELSQELQDTEKKLEDFKRDVLKLAENFNKIPINTERLKLAKQYFDISYYQAARVILDAEQLSQDQHALLDKQRRTQDGLAESTAY